MTETEILTGYRPGLLGEVAAWHGRYYSENWGFTSFFEAKVMGGISEFATRLDDPRVLLASAWSGRDFLGSLTVDNDGDRQADCAHLRWFIMSDAARGKGLGRKLFATAMEFMPRQGYRRAYLTTFKGLGAAARLYSDFGFTLTDEQPGNTWGVTVTEQRFDIAF